MKGKYNGCRMTIYGAILPGTIAIARSAFLTDKLTELYRANNNRPALQELFEDIKQNKEN